MWCGKIDLVRILKPIKWTLLIYNKKTLSEFDKISRSFLFLTFNSFVMKSHKLQECNIGGIPQIVHRQIIVLKLVLSYIKVGKG